MPNNNIRKFSFPLLLGFNASLTGTLAYAETERLVLEEVTVTARRQTENLQDVPIAVTAIGAEALNLVATDLGDIQNLVPNLTLYQGDASNAVVYVRGIGQRDSLAFADPGVGIYLDQVYLGRAQGAFLDIFDIERIEVLRGPQGTLYGRNTIGGAIKYVSRAPGNELAGEVSVLAGDYGRRDIKATLEGPLIDGQLMAKASVAKMSRDGYARNTFTGGDDGDKDTLAGRLSLLWDASDAISVTLALDHTDDDPETSRTPVRATEVFGIAPNSDPFKVQADFNDRNELETGGVAVTVDWQLNDALTLLSISSSRSMDYAAHLDLDATELAIFNVFVDQEQDQFSQELQLTYLGDKLTAVAGLYYFNEEDVTESGIFGPVISFINNSENDLETDSYAAYGDVSYQWDSQWRLTAGLRYTSEEKSFKRVQEFYPADQTFPPELGTGLQVTNIDVDDDWEMFTPKLGVDYQFDDDAMAYASISKGFKSGGFDGRSNDEFGATPYDEETLWAYELGIKSKLWQQRLQLNAAVFYYDYEDLQLSSFTAAEDGSFQALFTNAGEAETYGAELELSALLAEGFTVDLNLGYLDAEYEEFIGADGEDISDEREMVNSPEWTSRLAVSYELLLADGGTISLNADVAYRDKVYSTVSSSEVLAQSGYSIWNAQVQWLSPDQQWELLISGKNLTDKEYITHGFDLSDSLAYQLAYYGAPRTAYVSLAYKF